MATPHPFTISVRDIVRKPGRMRDAELTAPFGVKVGEGLATVLPEQPVDLDVRLESVHEGILATGEAFVTALATCSRCLVEFDLDVEVDFLELFAYAGASETDYLVVDETVDLFPVVRDAIVLALPFQPVDRPDWTPWAMTVPQLRRPSTRSTDLRSVPTMARFCTSNFSSDRKSTARWASS